MGPMHSRTINGAICPTRYSPNRRPYSMPLHEVGRPRACAANGRVRHQRELRSQFEDWLPLALDVWKLSDSYLLKNAGHAPSTKQQQQQRQQQL